MRKIMFLLCVLLLAMPLTFFASDEAYPISVHGKNTIFLSHSGKQSTQVMYSLTPEKSIEQLVELKSFINKNFDNYERNFTVHYTGSTANIEEEVIAIIRERLQNDEYFHRTLSEWAYLIKGYENNVMITLSMEYLTNLHQEQVVDREIPRILNEIISPHMTDFEKVKAVNDYIVLNTAYSFDTNSSPHSVYAILDEGKGVCQAYALLAYRLLNELGIETQYVVGVGATNEGSVDHAWNLVLVDGKWYHLDTTWNDPVPDQKTKVEYQYFLVPDAILEIDHHWEKGNYPEAASYDYANMHEMTGAITVNDVVYYRNRVDEKLYKFELRSKEKTKLTDNQVRSLALYNKDIYYSNNSNRGYLTKIHIDGTNETVLNKVHTSELFVEYPYLYYVNEDNNGTLEKMELERSDWDRDFDISDRFDETDYYFWEAKTENDRKHQWKIKLSLPVQEEQINDEQIYILDGNGNRLSFITPIVENEQTVRLQNSGKFLENMTYYVVVEKGLTSKSGKMLTKGVVMPFVVK